MERNLAGLSTTEEQEELAVMLRSEDNRELFNTVLTQMMRNETPAVPEDEGRWQRMAQDIVEVDKPGAKVIGIGRRIRWSRWVAAAVVLLVIAGGYLFWQARKLSSKIGTGDMYALASTGKGELREVVLPDGTHVWLNSSSTLEYPVAFNGRERSVELQGEAFFDVQHADKIPFIIHTGATTTTVLGTSFDIMSYPHQQHTTVSVQTGKVKVQTGEKMLAILEKGRQVLITADTAVVQKSIDAAAVAAWRTGDLLYKDETLEDIAADLERVFNEPIEIKTASLQKVMVTFSINKRVGLQHALEMICRITGGKLSHAQGKFTIE